MVLIPLHFIFTFRFEAALITNAKLSRKKLIDQSKKTVSKIIRPRMEVKALHCSEQICLKLFFSILNWIAEICDLTNFASINF